MSLRLLVLCCWCVVAAVTASAADPVGDDAKFWQLPLSDGWSNLPLTGPMQARVHGQFMIQDASATRSVVVAVRPDARDKPIIDKAFAENFIDQFIAEARTQGVAYTRAGAEIITWDGLPAAEIVATVDEGDGGKGVVFRLLAANGFLYSVRAIQEGNDTVDQDLRTALAAFRLTKKPEPVVESAAAVDASGDPIGPSSGAELDPEPEHSAGTLGQPQAGINPLFIIGGLAVFLIGGVAVLPYLLRGRNNSKKKVSRRRNEPTDDLGVVESPRVVAGRRTTVRMSPVAQDRANQTTRSNRATVQVAAGRRTTVRMPASPVKPTDKQAAPTEKMAAPKVAEKQVSQQITEQVRNPAPAARPGTVRQTKPAAVQQAGQQPQPQQPQQPQQQVRPGTVRQVRQQATTQQLPAQPRPQQPQQPQQPESQQDKPDAPQQSRPTNVRRRPPQP